MSLEVLNEAIRPQNCKLLQFDGPERPLATRRDEVLIGEPHACPMRLPSRIAQCSHASIEIRNTENGDIMNELLRMEVRQNLYSCFNEGGSSSWIWKTSDYK